MGSLSRGQKIALYVAVVLVVVGAAWGIPKTGIKLGMITSIASMGPIGPGAAGVFATNVGVPGSGAEVAAFVGEFAAPLASIHPALPYLAGIVSLLLAGEVRRYRK